MMSFFSSVFMVILYLCQKSILEFSINTNLYIKMNWNFFLFWIYMSLNLIFHISDIHNLKIVHNIFFFILESGLIFLSWCVRMCVWFGVVGLDLWHINGKGMNPIILHSAMGK